MILKITERGEGGGREKTEEREKSERERTN